MEEVLINAVISVVTGIGLWALLPRGVVLTREVRSQDGRGEPLLDTWILRNRSALPVQIISVRVLSPETHDAGTGRMAELELPVQDGEDAIGVSLRFNDHVLDVGRTGQRSWRGLEVPAGETLSATVGIIGLSA